MGSTHFLSLVGGSQVAAKMLLTGTPPSTPPTSSQRQERSSQAPSSLASGASLPSLQSNPPPPPRPCSLAVSAHDAGDVVPEAIKLANKISKQSPTAVSLCVESLRRVSGHRLEERLQREAEGTSIFDWADGVAQAVSYASPEMLEGLAALKERRSPDFSSFQRVNA